MPYFSALTPLLFSALTHPCLHEEASRKGQILHAKAFTFLVLSRALSVSGSRQKTQRNLILCNLFPYVTIMAVPMVTTLFDKRSSFLGKTFIYHGSYQKIESPEIRLGKNTKDFGVGFYCTTIKEQAERWAIRYNTPIVNVYSLQINEKLNILEFKTMSEEWLDFIVACRNGKPHSYDIVIGAMANDQIYNYISDYIDGVLTREQFWVLARFKYPTHQITFCTQEALACISYQSSEEVFYERKRR